MLVTDGAPEKFEQVFNTYNRPHIRVRVFTYLIGRDVADREAVEWMACANNGETGQLVAQPAHLKQMSHDRMWIYLIDKTTPGWI